MRSLIRYYGGKWRIAPWIVSLMPEHTRYVEPFAGAASVLLRKPRCYAEVLNDINGDIVNLFKVIRDNLVGENGLTLAQTLRLTPFAREEYDLSFQPSGDPVERARRLVVRSMCGFNADTINVRNSQSGFRRDIGRKFTIPAHDLANYPEKIHLFVERLRGVVIENQDATDIIRYYDKFDDVLFYLDPPYLHSTRRDATFHGYAREMSDDDHAALVDIILSLKNKVMLSGYDNDIYARLLDNGFTKVTRSFANATFQAGERTECLWCNFRTEEAINVD